MVILGFAREHNLQAASVQTVVGSLTQAAIRYANLPDVATVTGYMEIVSLVGTISPPPYGPHLHISLSFSNGTTIGGHLEAGNKIYTTAEIVLTEATALRFQRPVDPATTYDELQICCRD
jgi:predicted DNA-binding protein with PD1-like motif